MCTFAQSLPHTRTLSAKTQTNKGHVSSHVLFVLASEIFSSRLLTLRRHTAQLKHLETKLEKIAQSLSAKHDQDAAITRDARLPSLHRVTDTLDRAPEDIVHNLPQQAEQDIATTAYSRASTHNLPCGKAVLENGINSTSVHETEVLFDRYKRLMAPNMPFVVLPHEISATELAKSEPFLMNAIQVVASYHDTCQQQAMATKLIREMCERLLVNGEKSLGLLQGLLVFVNWYNSHLYSPRNSANLLHLAIALTTDLNIDRGPGNCEKARMETAMRAYGFAQSAKVLSNDERRAVLGTFYLTSLMFTSFRKVDALHWTPWLMSCVTTLSEACEYESDGDLVQLVHMQRIMQEALATEHQNAPCHLYAKSFLKDLESLKTQFPQSTMPTVLHLQDACARVAIWQRSFASIAGNPIGSEGLRQRLDGMWNCMEAVKDYVDLYMKLPVNDYPTLPFGVFAQFAYTFVVIIRAFSVDMDGWDAHALNGFIDFSAIIEEVSRRYDAVSLSSLDGVALKNEAFSKLGGKLRWAKTFHDARLASALSETRSALTANHSTTELQFTIGSGPTQDLPTPPDVASDPLLQSFAGFEDFWNVFSDPSYPTVGFDHTFDNI
jgi:hypothetical protein